LNHLELQKRQLLNRKRMQNSSTPAKIGFIGLGKMGNPMAIRLLTAGYEVTAFDVDALAVARLVSDGASQATETSEIAQSCDFIILMLPNSEIVNSVVMDENFLKVLKPGSVIIDMSSSEPISTKKLAASLLAREIHFVDAPVSGGVKGAVEGKLTIMVGGDDSDVDRIRPILANLGRVLHVGTVASGHAIKAFNNLLSAAHLWATSEVISAGVRFGLDPKRMLEAFNGASGKSGSTENKWPNFILPGTYNSGFTLALMLKDMKIAVKLAADAGTPLILGKEVADLWEKASLELAPLADHTEVAKWIEENL